MSTFHHRPTPLVAPQACARPRRSWLPRWLKRTPPRAAAPPQRYLAEAITPYLAPDAGMSVGTLYTVRPCSLEAIRYRFPNFPAGGKIEYWTELCVAVCDEGVVVLLRPERPDGAPCSAKTRARAEELQDHLAHWASCRFGRRVDASMFPALVCGTADAVPPDAWIADPKAPPAFWATDTTELSTRVKRLLSRRSVGKRYWPVSPEELVEAARAEVVLAGPHPAR